MSHSSGVRALVAVALLHAPGALAGGAIAAPSEAPRVGVVWVGAQLPASCRLDLPTVEREVRRIFAAMEVEIDWKVPATSVVHHRQEIVVVALPTDALERNWIMGAATRGANAVWVYCSTVARALGLDPRASGSTSLLSQAVGRVVAHEIVHALAPTLPHSFQGLMAAHWAKNRLVDPVLDVDAATRLAVQQLLLARSVTTIAP